MKKFLALFILLLPFCVLATGYVIEKKTISSGTGFFVNMLGNIVTNEHVVRNCKKIMVKGSVDITPASLIAIDTDNDLALLKINLRPSGYAKLRADFAMEPGDRVMIIGYPKEHAVSGDYAVQMASIIDTKGPMGESQWIQFSDSASQGNSGGPLVDKNGNVIGVVRAKVKFYKLDYNVGQPKPADDEVIKNGTPFKSSDIAITSTVLESFLNKAAVPYTTVNLPPDSDYSLEQNASSYIVNVHCYLD